MQVPDLSVVDVFATPYEHWSKRPATHDEINRHYAEHGWLIDKVPDQLLSVVSTPVEAAKHILLAGSDNRFDSFVETALASSSALKEWRRAMPSKTPPEISRYQRLFADCDLDAVDLEISAHGVPTPQGQIVFHGGRWPGGSSDSFTTDKPLSTTLSPSVALRNADHRGKAYDAGEVHLLVMRVDSPSIKAFVFRQKGTQLGHEREVLFPSGLRLERRSMELVRKDYPASRYGQAGIVIPGSVMEVSIFPGGSAE